MFVTSWMEDYYALTKDQSDDKAEVPHIFLHSLWLTGHWATWQQPVCLKHSSQADGQWLFEWPAVQVSEWVRNVSKLASPPVLPDSGSTLTWIWHTTKCDHLIQQDAIRPHIRLDAELAVKRCLWGRPLDGELGSWNTTLHGKHFTVGKKIIQWYPRTYFKLEWLVFVQLKQMSPSKNCCFGFIVGAGS